MLTCQHQQLIIQSVKTNAYMINGMSRLNAGCFLEDVYFVSLNYK